jgi:hypothetical protein
MTNLFAILGLPESLLLDHSEIEGAWRAATKKAHPDQKRDSESLISADLNRARSVLSSPAERLAHWLELKAGEHEANRSLDPELMDLFASVHTALQKADSVISRNQNSTTALAKALLTKESVEAQLCIQQKMSHIHQFKESIINIFPEIDEAARSGNFESAQRNLSQLKFLTKWEQQCQARLLSLLEG